MNSLLKNITGSLGGTYFAFPKDENLTTADIGKLLMNDGSGTAKVYEYSAATTEQLGSWLLAIEDIGSLGNESAIKIDSSNHTRLFNRDDWRNGATPTTPLEELTLIKAHIDSIWLSHISTSIIDDKLIIEENTFDGTIVTTQHFPFGSLTLESHSNPTLPALPTAYPLGKLIAIEGENAIISSNQVETYTLSGELTINPAIFDSSINIDFNNPQTILDFASQVVVPGENGTVTPLDLSLYDFQHLRISFRHQIVGIPISTNSTTVTVLNLNHGSLIINILLRLMRSGISS